MHLGNPGVHVLKTVFTQEDLYLYLSRISRRAIGRPVLLHLIVSGLPSSMSTQMCGNMTIAGGDGEKIIHMF